MEAAGGNGTGARILIADDEPQVRAILRALLSVDYECREVGSAEEALELLRAESFDLVLSDIMMPGLSGLDMVPRLLEISPDTVVLMISGESNIESAISAMRVGAFDYITKPFTLDHVEAAARRALDHHALLASKRYYENFLQELVRQRTDELGKANCTLSTLIQGSPLALFALDAEGRVTMWNPAAAHMFGWGEGEVLGNAPPYFAEGRAVERPAWLEAAVRGEHLIEHEARWRKKDGSPVDVSVWTASLKGASGEVEGTMLVVADVTERKAAEARINYLAYYDALTGLPNRVLFEERLTQSLAAAHRRGRMLVVMFVALDRFKKYTDTLGHTAGDRLLRMVAERLSAELREGDTVARFEGGEFSLLLTSVGGTGEAAEAARQVQRVLEAPFDLDGQNLYVTASVGIGLYPYDSADAQSLLKSVGAALYRARRLGGNNYQFYAADMNEQAVRRLALENNLRRAIDNAEFVLHYQPKVGGDDARVVGVEALLRWRNPELGLVSPAEFIPLAEETGLIVPIGEWVLRSALAQHRAWQQAGLAPPRVSVNLSLRQFQQPDLVEVIDGLLREVGLDPGCLELELTESLMMRDAASAVATLRELKEMGIHIAIDDFGSGYSSLAYLKSLPIDTLKIDKAFVREMTDDPNDAAIVMAIITLAHSLKLSVVAEGVETEEQLRFLRLLRCDAVQGYLFSKPLPAEDFGRLLSEGGRMRPNAYVSAPNALTLRANQGGIRHSA